MSQTLAILAFALSYVYGNPMPLDRDAIPYHGGLDRRQQTPTPGNWSDPRVACATLDINNPVEVQQFWEESPIPGVFAVFLQESISPPNQNWPFKMFNNSLPEAGLTLTGDCGALGATDCNPQLNCASMAATGSAEFYWILEALSGFQSKLNIANTALQGTGISSTLKIDKIAADFSTPMTSQPLAGLAGLISAIFFLVGAGGGVAIEGVTLAVDEEAAAGAQAALSAARAAEFRALENAEGQTGDVLTFIQQSAAQEVKDAEARLAAIESDSGLDVAAGAKTGAGALAAAAGIMGSVFNMVNAVHGYETQQSTGQVDKTAVSSLLETLFDSATDQLRLIGLLTVGGASNASDYDQLPGYAGSGGPVYMNNSIVEFFSDGKFLLGGASNTAQFEEVVTTGYGFITKKLVDYALQSAGYLVLSLPATQQSDCTATYGAQWIARFGSGVCLMLFQQSSKGGYCASPLGDAPDSNSQSLGPDIWCNYLQPPRSIFDTLQNEYYINMYDYYSTALSCAVNGTGVEDTENLPTDNSLPLCFFNPQTQNADFSADPSDSGLADNVQDVQLSNFTMGGS